MLAFIGNVWESPTSRPVVAALANALLDFSFGFLASAVAAGLTYCTQFMYSSDRNRVGRALNLAAVGTVLFAYALFVSGSLSAYSAIEQHLAPAELAER